MTKRKRTKEQKNKRTKEQKNKRTKVQTSIYKTLHRKLKIEQHEPH